MKIVFQAFLLGAWEGSRVPVCPAPHQETPAPIPGSTGGAVDDSPSPFHPPSPSPASGHGDGLATQACQSQCLISLATVTGPGVDT